MPTRRTLLLSAAAQPDSPLLATAIRRHDEGVDQLLTRQTNDPKSRWFGGLADGFGLHHGGSAMGMMEGYCTALAQPKSRHYGSKTVFEALRRAGTFLDRHSNPGGSINSLITNFNSPPDTAFGVRALALGALMLKRAGNTEVLAYLRPHLERAGRALAEGGIHTPNHRWIMCSSLAQLNEVLPDARYVRRIDQWLAEGIDIDEDAQFTERSSGTYNMVVNSSLVIIADKLNRPELLEPVRRNIDAALHLMHADGELLTDISSRQDQFTRSSIDSYWFALHYLALRDKNPVYAGLALKAVSRYAGLSYLMAWPDFQRTDLPTAPPPSNYERWFPRMGVQRIRRELTSATLLTQANDRFFQFRHGDAVINAVRFATGFFGKGQFEAETVERSARSYKLTQKLKGPYFQPFEPSRRVDMTFDETRAQRRQTEICELTQSATIVEKADRFEVTIEATGTDEVPVVIEINFREGGRFTGTVAAKEATDAHYFTGNEASYAAGKNTLRIAPGLTEHRWIVVRGAQPKLPGPSLYVTGYTPFKHTLTFRWS